MKFTKQEISNTFKIVTSNSVSKLGDILFDYVNSVWLSKLGSGSFWMAIYQSSETFIGIFVNLIGGVLSDFKNRQNIIWLCDTLSGILCIILSLFIPNSIFLYAIIFVNLALAILSSIRDPAYKAIFTEIVAKEKIGRVNSILETFKQIIKIAGPSVSMLISKFADNKMALLLDGLSFIISGVLIKYLNLLIKDNHLNFEKKKQNNFQKIKEGFNYLVKEKQILFIILFASIINFVLAGYELILPFANFAFTKYSYALFLTAQSIGGLLGAAVSNIGKHQPTNNLLFFWIICSGISLLFVNPAYQITNIIMVSAIFIAIFNFFISIFNIQFMTFVQIKTSSEFIGRIFSIVFTVAIIFAPIGTFFFQSIFNVKQGIDYTYFGILLIIISGLAIVIGIIKNYKEY